jgi:AraC-like DNA-binding protein
VEVEVRKVHSYELLAPEINQLRKQGASFRAIACKLGVCEELVKESAKFSETGEPPAWRPPGKRKGQRSSDDVLIYKSISPEVVRLRDEEELSFPRIAERITAHGKTPISEGTARRAYDWGRPDVVEEVINGGKNIDRGRYTHLSRDTLDLARELLNAGLPVNDVAERAHCSPSTVRRILKELSS